MRAEMRPYALTRHASSNAPPALSALRRAARAGLALLIVACAAGAACRSAAEPHLPSAVIVDQLAATNPNEGFVSRTRSLLEGAGYRVDYVAPQDVTVDYYRKLPSRGYDLVILRSHSATVTNRTENHVVSGPTPYLEQKIITEPNVSLFTNERASEAHADELRSSRVDLVYYDDAHADDKFFGIRSPFILGSTKGNFRGATIVLMGCGGLSSDSMAQAFVAKGAAEFISWDGLVSAAHTDATTEALLRALVIDHASAEEATRRAMDATGPDPVFGSHLLRYVPSPAQG